MDTVTQKSHDIFNCARAYISSVMGKSRAVVQRDSFSHDLLEKEIANRRKRTIALFETATAVVGAVNPIRERHLIALDE